MGEETTTVAGEGFAYTFDHERGTLSSIEVDGREYLQRGPLLNAYRVPISNEVVGWGAAESDEWFELGLDDLERKVESVEATEVADGVTRVEIRTFATGADSEAGFDVSYLYHVLGTGDVLLGVRAVPNEALRRGISHWLPKVGVQMELADEFEELSWYGEGPQENYPDRDDGTKVGTYRSSVTEEFTRYVRPQDYGNKTEVRWSELSDGDGAGLTAFGYPDLNVSAHDVANLDRALFDYQLEERDGVLFNLDHAVSGVGGTPVQALPEYRVVPDSPFEFVVGIRPRTADDAAPDELARRRLPYAFAATNTFGQFEAKYDADSGRIEASAVVRNAGGQRETIDAPLTIGGEAVDSREITLDAGDKTDVSFEYDAGDAGVFEVAIGDVEPALFTVPEKSLAGEWQFRKGNDESWVDPGYDDSGWQTVELPANWEDHSDYTDDQVYGWYRKTIEIPEEWDGNALEIPMGRIDDVDETFLNGQKIGQTGTFPENGYETAWNVTRRYVASADQINFGGENVVAVRVYDGTGGGGLHGGPLGPITAVRSDE